MISILNVHKTLGGDELSCWISMNVLVGCMFLTYDNIVPSPPFRDKFTYITVLSTIMIPKRPTLSMLHFHDSIWGNLGSHLRACRTVTRSIMQSTTRHRMNALIFIHWSPGDPEAISKMQYLVSFC